MPAFRPYRPCLLHWHRGNRDLTIAQVPAKQSCMYDMVKSIRYHHKKTQKMCAYFLACNVFNAFRLKIQQFNSIKSEPLKKWCTEQPLKNVAPK